MRVYTIADCFARSAIIPFALVSIINVSFFCVWLLFHTWNCMESIIAWCWCLSLLENGLRHTPDSKRSTAISECRSKTGKWKMNKTCNSRRTSFFTIYTFFNVTLYAFETLTDLSNVWVYLLRFWYFPLAKHTRIKSRATKANRVVEDAIALITKSRLAPTTINNWILYNAIVVC